MAMPRELVMAGKGSTAARVRDTAVENAFEGGAVQVDNRLNID